MALLGLILAILLGGHGQAGIQNGIHGVPVSPADTLGDTTGG